MRGFSSPGAATSRKPAQAASFDAFAPFVKTRWDDRYLYVESDGMTHAPLAFHPLMVGIKSWQQQVPLPQNYVGENAWRFPLAPELAETPISAKTELYRGAIAIAVNGVPIFNALNNRGDDAFLAGELDEYGGHSGRADERYHYHVAPLALVKVVGIGKPIAYALDGFAIYGLFDAKAAAGSERACPLRGKDALDDLNGHFAVNADGTRGTYHYHATTGFPYINGGMRGKVTVKEDQIDPQPRDARAAHAHALRVRRSSVGRSSRSARGRSTTRFAARRPPSVIARTRRRTSSSTSSTPTRRRRPRPMPSVPLDHRATSVAVAATAPVDATAAAVATAKATMAVAAKGRSGDEDRPKEKDEGPVVQGPSSNTPTDSFSHRPRSAPIIACPSNSRATVRAARRRSLGKTRPRARRASRS